MYQIDLILVYIVIPVYRNGHSSQTIVIKELEGKSAFIAADVARDDTDGDGYVDEDEAAIDQRCIG